MDFLAPLNDTLLFTAHNYSMTKVPVGYFASGPRDIKLLELSTVMTTSVITATKTPSEIRQDIEKLGIKETDTYKNWDKGLAPIQSPITFLYEMFSKKERSKREVALLEFDDERKRILKDITRVLMQYEVIDLEEKNLSPFIDSLPITGEWMKSSTDYDIALAIKNYFERGQFNPR